MSLLWYNSANQMTKPRMCGVCYCMTSWEKIRCGCCKKKHSICVSCHKSRYHWKMNTKGVWYTWFCRKCSKKEDLTQRTLQRIRR